MIIKEKKKNSCSIDLSSPPPPSLRALSRSSLFPKRIKKAKASKEIELYVYICARLSSTQNVIDNRTCSPFFFFFLLEEKNRLRFLIFD
jgi:hypothetical protein